ncbi:NAD(P)/FAD-dependent oxidoreductase [Oceanibacterium hippocampi]|uniref:NAD(P)/FAD-dependent oxidoreductase n=1 Tax=Oceanibacterium hippocampi TaxID=745714 RepID=UPI001592C2AB|nr:FAD-dependent oxidoreductase [Oceanibacterium hippocampi]
MIVGAGQAGARTAAALRKQGWQDRILLLGDEPDPPYERPPLSKDVLAGSTSPENGRIYGPEWYADNAIELRTSARVETLEIGARRIVSGGGSAENFDILVLATGCRARTVDCPGTGLEGVLSLRTARDARRLEHLLGSGGDVVLVGGGFIGLEVAASAVARGCRVTVLETQTQLLERAVSSHVADHLARRHRHRGVDIRLGARVVAFEGRIGRLRAVRLADGSCLPADVAVVGVGGIPNVELAQAAGLSCDTAGVGGILTDSHCRVADDVYAVGDCARFDDAWLGRPVRLESWENAELAPQAAAKAILGAPEGYGGVPWFWTDQYDLNLQLLGLKQPVERVLVRCDPESGSFLTLGLSEGRIAMAALFNAGRERRPLKQLIELRAIVDPRALADPDTPLKRLAKEAAANGKPD